MVERKVMRPKRQVTNRTPNPCFTKAIIPKVQGDKILAPIDAQQLLNALAPLLALDGSIKGPDEASRISSLMKDASKMVSKCVYLNILKITKNNNTLEKFINVGGWDTLYTWLQHCKGPEYNGFLIEILKVYKDLPVTIDLLKQNNAAKTIKQLAKSETEHIKILSGDIVERWMKTVREARTTSDDADKKKDKKRKKDKDHHSGSKEKSKDKDNSSESNEKLVDSNHKHEHSNHKHEQSKHRHNSSEEKSSKRPKTVKTVASKFRSTGLEDQTIAPVKKKTPVEAKPLPVITKRNVGGLDEPPEKKPRLTITIPTPSLSSATTLPTSTSPSSTSPPEVTYGKIKLIPAKRLPTHEIHEDSGFMNSLVSPRYGGVIKKKKKITSPVTLTTPPVSGPPQLKPAVPNTSPTSANPLSPTTSLAQRLPSVPSFYKDTLETYEENQAENERSPSPEEENPPNLQMPLLSPERPTTPTDDLENKNSEDTENKDNGAEENENDEHDENSSEQKGLLTTGPTKKKKAKKKLRWADENRLRQYFYFELDETERENVNRPKDFNSLKKAERMMEGRAMDSARRLSHDNQTEAVQWRQPELLEGMNDVVVPGVNSTDREIQNQREQGVLQALFFSKAMLPDTPTEPELESVDATEPKIIPLEDGSTSGEEYSYTYDNMESKPDKLKADPPPIIPAQNSFLPPELTNILNNFSKNPPTGNNVPNDMMQNVQNMLAVIMQASQDGNQNEMIEKLRMVLEPFRHQLPELFHQNFGQPNMMTGPPRMGSGLLGAAPPGFAPLGPPPRFMGPPPGHGGPPPIVPGGPPLGPGGPLMRPGGPPHGPGGPPHGPGGPPHGPGGPPHGPGGPPHGPGGPPHGPGGPPHGPPLDDWGENMMGGPMGPRGPIRHGFPRSRGGPMNRGPGRGRGGGFPGRGGRDRNGDTDRGDRRDRERDGRNDRNDRGGGRGRGRGGKIVCRHFTGGGCKYGDACTFLHPGVGGPPQKT